MALVLSWQRARDGRCLVDGDAVFAFLPRRRVQSSYAEYRDDRLVGHRLSLLSGVALGKSLPAAPGRSSTMRSIYERALGSDFQRLHPEIQRRFGFSSAGKV